MTKKKDLEKPKPPPKISNPRAHCSLGEALS
jgi:hypothetical protein